MRFADKFGVRFIALFEGGKATLMMSSLLAFIFIFHSNAYDLVKTLVKDLHVDPDNHYVLSLLMITSEFTGVKLLILCACAFLYSMIKISEAYGLWHRRQWGRTLGIASIGVLIPYEFYELLHLYTHIKLLTLLVNSAIVLYLFLYFNRPVPKQ